MSRRQDGPDRVGMRGGLRALRQDTRTKQRVCARGVVTAILFAVRSRPNGPLAQLAEQQTLNLRVEGSIPSRLTTSPKLPILLSQEVSLAKVAELVYALDLGSSPERSGWGFESPLSHQTDEVRPTDERRAFSRGRRALPQTDQSGGARARRRGGDPARGARLRPEGSPSRLPSGQGAAASWCAAGSPRRSTRRSRSGCSPATGGRRRPRARSIPCSRLRSTRSPSSRPASP